MSKVALYFRRWKNYTRQKNVGEDWAFANESKLTDLSENLEDAGGNGFPELDIFRVKFLGSTTIHAAKSEEATANAIKGIIATAKVSNKKLQRLKLSICPKGIQTFDAMTGETLHNVSIYQISYCSADASHSNVFAFIAGTGRETANEMYTNDTDELTCYAFLCAKRKIAYNLTVTVAKNFERAYDMWKKSEHRKTEQCAFNTNNIRQNESVNSYEPKRCDNLRHSEARKSLLIDFNSESAANATQSERKRQILQTAWVSFDDEPLLSSNNTDMHPIAGKIFENNLWDMNVTCS